MQDTMVGQAALPHVINVVKADGRLEGYDPAKTEKSIRKAGLNDIEARKVMDAVGRRIRNGMSTNQIRNLVLDSMYKVNKKAALSYKKNEELLVRTSKGTIETFDTKRIRDSLVEETGIDKDAASKIARHVSTKLSKLGVEYLTSPLIREMVCVELLEEGYEKERLLYVRLGMPTADVTRLIEHGSKENANLHHNPETIHKFAGDQIIREYMMTRLMPKHIVDAHLRGDIHLHDSDYYAIRPNCLQHDLSWFLKNGLRVDGTGDHTSVAGAPKHAMVAAMHAAKILASSQTNMAGGQSLDNFNIFMAPFFEGKTYDEVKQVAQMFVYEMNMQYVARGGQTVFSNMNLELTIPKYLAGEPAYGPKGKIVGTYGDFEDETQVFTDALLDVFLEGDARGKPHLFPSVIVKARPSAFKDERQKELMLKVHQLFSKYGTPYILNLCAPWQHDAVNSMGCRTRLSGDWADKQGYPNPRYGTMRTGNIHYNTINLPRIGIEANGDDTKIFELLDQRLELVKESLIIKHDIIDRRLHVNNLLPFLSQKGVDGDEYYQFKDLTHTVGFVGLNELLEVLTGKGLHEDGAAYGFGKRVLEYMRNWADRTSDETGWRWTLTQSPAESTAGRFAKLDYREYDGRAPVKGDKATGSVYYTNSNHIRVDADVPLYERATMEGGLHKICNGGHITHLFLGEETPNPAGLMSLTEKLCKNTGMGLFDYTRDLTTCKKCNTVSGGIKPSCPNCGATGNMLEYYSRITGYCQRIGSGDSCSGWNDSKVAELKDRRRYTV